ncbi:MAG: antibiotic biosynthesis monooxygenase [Ferruginibacter sp.]
MEREPHYINVTVHVDPANKGNILLYKHWDDEEYYKEDHMRTPHLQQFMKKRWFS